MYVCVYVCVREREGIILSTLCNLIKEHVTPDHTVLIHEHSCMSIGMADRGARELGTIGTVGWQ